MPANNLQLNLFTNSYKNYGYSSADSVPIARINQIEIQKFRNLANRTIKLGKRITVISGRNATNKTSILGMIAHPFNTDKKDCFGRDLKTKMSEVFRMSSQYDKKYVYSIQVTDTDNRIITESFNFFLRSGTRSFRVFSLNRGKGDGNFSYNTTFLGLARLTPIVDTDIKIASNAKLSKKEMEQMSLFYQQILPAKDYSSFEGAQDKKRKETFGPGGENREYDFNTISSGEDILGAIFNKIIAFQRAKSDDPHVGNGIFCIDEIEASLHPSAQVALFEYLLSWSKEYKVQVAFTTHSLHLINTIYNRFQNLLDNEDIVINFLSKSEDNGDRNYPVIINPQKEIAYNELTLLDSADNLHKIKVFCEDNVAKNFIENLLNENILNNLDIVTNTNNNQKGTSWDALKGLCTTYASLANNSIVVFDADVAGMSNVTNKIADNIKYCFLPDADNFPLEKRIALFILSITPVDFKKRFGVSQDLVLSELAKCHLNTTISNLIEEKNIQKFKTWAKKDPRFNAYISHYANTLNQDFQTKLIEQMNLIYQEQGLSLIH